MAITVVAQVPGLTAEEDAAVVEALDLEGSPPAGRKIRLDGPASHLLTKKGTPTMGGLMILSGVLVAILLWANLTNVYVWIVLGVTISFGFSLKIRRK